jgi:hypothetical protein
MSLYFAHIFLGAGAASIFGGGIDNSTDSASSKPDKKGDKSPSGKSPKKKKKKESSGFSCMIL